MLKKDDSLHIWSLALAKETSGISVHRCFNDDVLSRCSFMSGVERLL